MIGSGAVSDWAALAFIAINAAAFTVQFDGLSATVRSAARMENTWLARVSDFCWEQPRLIPKGMSRHTPETALAWPFRLPSCVGEILKPGFKRPDPLRPSPAADGTQPPVPPAARG